MKYNELTLKRHKSAGHVGRGIAAGRGKTAGRGTKGQGARKSGGVRPGFEGGQMPLYMRLPKLRGFKSKRPKVETVYTGQLESLKKPAIDNQVLFEAGLVSSPYAAVKLLLKGELTSKKAVRLQSASTAAVVTLQKSGGSFTATDRQARPVKKPKES
jgi:large subunit ribosomal protein L15